MSLQVTYRSNNGSTRCFYSTGWLIKRGKLNSVVHGTVITDRPHSGLLRKIQRLFTFFANPNYSILWQQSVAETIENYNLRLKAFNWCFLSSKFDLNLSWLRSEKTLVYIVTFSCRKLSPCASHKCTELPELCSETRDALQIRDTVQTRDNLQISDTVRTRDTVKTCDTVQTRDTL